MRQDRSQLPTLRLTTLKQIKRLVIAVVGGTVLAVGLALIVLPGPAFLVIPAGLAILAIEFAWANRWLRKARAWLPGKSVRGSTGDPPVLPGDSPGGTGKPSVTKKNAACTANIPVVPVCGSPIGAGESPAPPVFQTRPQPGPYSP